MKRKLCCLALAATLLLSLSACGGKKPVQTEEERVVPPVTAAPDHGFDTRPAATETESPETGTPGPVETDAPTSDEPQPVVTDAPAFRGPVLVETEDMGQAYIDGITFLGDSTTYGLKYYEMLSGGEETQQVWTPASGTLTLSYQGFATIVYPPTEEEIPIRDAVERAKPEMMVITLGVNGVSFMDEETFVAEYTSLVTDIQAISPDTKIILQSIFPIAANYEYQGDINNSNIPAANEWVRAVAESTGVRYLDTYSVLIGEDGYMPEEYQNGDGLHLNEIGFGVVLDYIRTHGYQ